MLNIESLTSAWLELPKKSFARQALLNDEEVRCDCSGLVNLLCHHLSVPIPYGLERPKAVHYFGVLQEIGSNHISQIKPWNLLAWRKDAVPKKGDTGHVLLIAGEPVQLEETVYRVEVIDATKVENGIARREIRLHTNVDGQLIGVRLHLSESKVKRTPIYHAPLLNKRYCFGCGVPQKICLCNQVEVSPLEPSVVILRHPDERKKTLSTVSLIKQRYPSVLVREGEIFNPLRLQGLTLLFPRSAATNETQFVENLYSVIGDSGTDETTATLILLDATWRKAKRMLHENGWLAELPRLSIESESISHYLLRKVPDANSLATVEVVAAVQGDVALHALFRSFMQKQIEVMGKDKYERNYHRHLNYTPN